MSAAARNPHVGQDRVLLTRPTPSPTAHYGPVDCMAKRDRRRARAVRDAARLRAEQRVQGRTDKLRASVPPEGVEDAWFPRRARWRRRDRQALRRGSGGGAKQLYKHLPKRAARSAARRAATRARVETYLAAATSAAPAQVVSVLEYGGCLPAEAWGDAIVRGESVVWYLRYRYDSAYLEVGQPLRDPDYGLLGPLVGACLLQSRVRGVIGEPYAGSFEDLGTEDDALAFVAQLFHDLQPPEPGVRFSERLKNTVDLCTGAGDATAPTLMWD